MEDLTGKQFGPYQIIAPLGEGGMAAVYKAYQPSMDRYVALKVLPRHFADDPEFTSRFQREAKLLAQLQHPHILPVFDYGQAEGYSYIVMPFIQGGTLMDSLKGEPLPFHRIRQVISQVADALNYAHSHGLIHRDVKPSNVLIDESGNYLLTDFGLARMVEPSTKLTASGAIVGTPAYMSPEQGAGLKLDARSDIYSLGVILYEMATGRAPYRAETPIAVIIKHINDPLPPPRSVNPQLSEVMERAILKALAKNPEDRFQTAVEMIRAVEAASGSEADVVSAQAAETKNVIHETVSPILLWRNIWETPRGKVALIGGAVVVLVLGLLWSRWSSPLQIAEPNATRQVADEAGTPLGSSLTNVPLTPSPTRTMGPTNTPNPLELGERLEQCGSDLCIVDGQSKQTHLGLASTYTGFHGFSWSPDKTRIVFVACLLKDFLAKPNAVCYENLYVANLDGSNSVAIAKGNENNSLDAPAWSPDGEWIVFGRSGGIELIHSDGTGNMRLTRCCAFAAAFATAWSPDGQRIATVGGNCANNTCIADRIFYINKDGSGFRVLFHSPDIQFDSQIAWSPDGQSVAVILSNGAVYQIDTNCQSNGLDGCDESSRNEIKEIPQDWHHTFHPQWISALNTAPTIVATTPSSPGEAFAAPILVAIADRPPDFEDDFSFAGKGWQSYESPYSSILDGVLKISVPVGETSNPGNTSWVGENNSHLSGLDFVFQMDVRAKSLPPDSGTGIIFRFLDDYKTTSSPQGYFTFDLFPSLGEWRIVDHHTEVENPSIAQGKSNAVTLEQWMKIRIIARGSTFAVYLNDQPLSYFVNDLHPMGTTSFFAGNGTGISAGDIQVEFDNVKFWNLANVPGLP